MWKLISMNYIFCFEAPGLIAQFSKCDFWNLEKISDRNMWSNFFSSIFFDRKKFDRKNIFQKQYFFDEKKSIEHFWKSKFWKFLKKQKIDEIFERKNRNFKIFKIVIFKIFDRYFFAKKYFFWKIFFDFVWWFFFRTNFSSNHTHSGCLRWSRTK